MPKEFFFALVAMLCAVSPVVSQTQSDDVVRITTNLVQVDVVVTKRGKPTKDLKAEDFEIFEDGKLQTITAFAYVSNDSSNAASSATSPGTSAKDPNTPSDPASPPPVPSETARRRIAFVVDDYGLSAQSIASIRRQLRKFIDEQMKPTDLVAIIRTSRARREMPPLMNDKSRINEAWDQLKWNQCSRVGVKSMQRVGDETPVGCGMGVGSFDESITSIRAIVTALAQVPGRKSMVIFSNDTPLREDEKLNYGSSSVITAGPGDSTSDDSRNYNARLKRLSEMAIRSSVVIYGIDAAGLQATQLTAADMTPPRYSGSEGNRTFTKQLGDRSKKIQSQRDGADALAKATGGFLVKDQNDFQFDKILEDQSGYYVIGYRPGTETFNKQFHKIRARVKQSGYEVRTRAGFFGLSEEDATRLKKTTDK
jgi:VWFA-related protein